MASVLCGNVRLCLDFFYFFYFLSLITPHSISVTHYSSLKISHHSTQSVFGIITQLIITQNFQLFVDPIPVTWCNFYCFFSFLFSFNPQYLNSLNPMKKKKNPANGDQWKKKKKRKRKKELSKDQKYYVMKNKKEGRTNWQ